jgi:hypothetical protein
MASVCLASKVYDYMPFSRFNSTADLVPTTPTNSTEIRRQPPGVNEAGDPTVAVDGPVPRINGISRSSLGEDNVVPVASPYTVSSIGISAPDV